MKEGDAAWAASPFCVCERCLDYMKSMKPLAN